MFQDKKRCRHCGKDPEARGYCRNCGAIRWYEVLGAFLGGAACVFLGLQTAYTARYSYEPILGGVVGFIGMWELGWAAGQLVLAYRVRRGRRSSRPSDSV